MPTICQFKFSRPTPIYYSGEQITGSITLSTTKELPVEAIELSLVGCERVQWLERNKADLILHNDSIEKDNNMIYSSEREFLYDTYTLAKRVRLLQDEVIMEEFCFTLPTDALASRSLKYGEIVYTLQLTLQRKSDFNKVFKARVIVKNRLDLNEAPELCKLYSINSSKDVPSNMDQPLCFILKWYWIRARSEYYVQTARAAQIWTLQKNIGQIVPA
ncbi:arrestin domain-containing protein 17 [Eurosta solidaginis]|uniref:arrestin domain-containing protein 17 n=1 Tax=Eurosta solidaginis TaxID=178769 RepID=UPI0035305CA5